MTHHNPIKYLIVLTSLLCLLSACQNKRQTKVENERSIALENKATIADNNSELKVEDIEKFIFNNDSIVELRIDCEESAISVDEILSPNVSFVKLETKQECLIGKIDEILFDDDKIFIIDKHVSKGVFIFDFNGHFLGKIANQGRGPEEFIEIQDVTLNKGKKEVHVLDAYGSKINCYNYMGEFLKGVKIKTLFHAFEYLTSNTAIRYKNRNFSPDIPAIQLATLYAISDNNILSYGFEEAKTQDAFSWNTQRQLWKYHDEVYYNSRFSDTIYRVSKDTVWGAYSLNFLGYNIPAKDRENLTNEKFEVLKDRYGYLNGDFIDLKDFVYLTVFLPHGSVSSIYSKETGRIVSGKKLLTYKYPLHIFFDSPLTLYKDNVVVEVVDAQRILRYPWEGCPVKSEFPELKEVFTQLNAGVRVDDNPILFFYELKTF
jgi:hypothetical protein